MVFFMYGIGLDHFGEKQKFLYQTKEMNIENKFKIHHTTRFIEKVVNNQSAKKFLVTLGLDYRFDENNNS